MRRIKGVDGECEEVMIWKERVWMGEEMCEEMSSRNIVSKSVRG